MKKILKNPIFMFILGAFVSNGTASIVSGTDYIETNYQAEYYRTQIDIINPLLVG